MVEVVVPGVEVDWLVREFWKLWRVSLGRRGSVYCERE